MEMKKIHLITTGLLLLVFIAVASVSALTLSSISPNTANPGTTGIFDVYGSGFQSGFGITQIMLRDNIYGDIGATKETFVSSRHIRATLAIPPAARPGYYTLWAKNNRDGTVVTKAIAFYVNALTPTIIRIQPSTADQGTTGTYNIYGSGFQTSPEVLIRQGTNKGTYTISATSAQISSMGQTKQISCSLSIPKTAPVGAYTLWVRNRGGTWVSKPNAFYVHA
jgi:hypothetical protein